MESNRKAPDYLYHYTDLETLSLIVKHKTIRFNPLNKMDDLQENEAKDLRKAGSLVFVSSWTEDSFENIAMWKIYSSLNSGVRIKLPAFPFNIYDNTPDSFRSLGFSVQGDGAGLSTLIPITEFFQKGYICPSALNPKGSQFLKRIEYTSDKEKLYPKLLSQDTEHVNISMESLGTYKNEYWAFQNEWRYILRMFPIEIRDLQAIGKNIQELVKSIIDDSVEIPFSHYDLTISDDAFKSMEVTMAPCFSEGNQAILAALKEAYNPNMTINESALQGLIR